MKKCWALTLRVALPALSLLFGASCEPAEQLRDRFRDLTPHEAYQESLELAGLHQTALGRGWIGAGRDALRHSVPVSVPFAEDGHIPPDAPMAVAYRITIPRGRRLTFRVDLESAEGTRLFIDLFRLAGDEAAPPRPVFSSDSVSRTFVYEPAWRGGEFLLRVQPELLRGGRYRVTVEAEPMLGFPVEGRGMQAILSVFGAPRDGGRREHRGVDIFAPRGTPVLAARAGRVRGVRDTNLGGKVVWLRHGEAGQPPGEGSRDARTYYAHLDSQYVRDGDWVEQGDTVGFVGNTGNARTTPPHLHFGLYSGGALDPYPFLDPPGRALPTQTADADLLGAWIEARRDMRLRGSLRGEDPVVSEVTAGTPIQVLGATGAWFRVRTLEGATGFVAAGSTVGATVAIDVDDLPGAP